METQRETVGASLHMQALAALSVAALIVVGIVEAWKALTPEPVSATNASGVIEAAEAETPLSGFDWQFSLTDSPDPSDPDGLANIEGNVASVLLDTYSELISAGAYTPEMGESIADDVASTLRARISYPRYRADDLTTDPDTSYERMLEYRADMRIALEPLMENPGYELGLFASYIESRDAAYLDKLRLAAENYRAAVAQAILLTVPEDARDQHVAVVNALSEFGATIAAMAEHADDAFAAAALLQSYSASEEALMTSFDALATYQKSKII